MSPDDEDPPNDDSISPQLPLDPLPPKLPPPPRDELPPDLDEDLAETFLLLKRARYAGS